MKLFTVILSGGSGSRLWPVSRQAYPKPFMRLGGKPLLEQTVSRAQACGASNILIVTNQDHLFLTQNLVAEMDNPPLVSYLLEPRGRNTAPAIALAALNIAQESGPDTVMLVLAADHLIPDTSAFVADVLEAARHAQKGKLVVFGIQPTAPDTGFGYIEVEKPSSQAQSVLKFVEKPNQAAAMEYLTTGRYYWNSGIFCFRVGDILEAFSTHTPDLLSGAQRAMTGSSIELGKGSTLSIRRFDKDTFVKLPEISIDYAVMERATNVTLVPAKFSWSDVGAWPAVANSYTADASGNTMAAENYIDWVSFDTSNTHVHIDSQGSKRVVATIGIHNTIIVHTPDTILVADKTHAQDVKKVVDVLKQRHIESDHYQVIIMPNTVLKPWGLYTTLKEEPGCKVKRITVYPGQSLSLQYHQHRTEHWIVVKGRGIVQVADMEYPTVVGGHHYIPLGEKHRLTNNSEEELVLIEVQLGNYLGEDDIVRLKDKYGRVVINEIESN